MRNRSFDGVVRIRLRMGLDINLDVTENYEDVIKAAVGELNGKRLSKNIPNGVITWTADSEKVAKQFLKKLNEYPIIQFRINDVQNKLRGLNESTSTLNVLEDIHHIDPVVVTIRNGYRTKYELTRSGYRTDYNIKV